MSTPNINDQFFNGIYKDVWRKLVPDGLTEAECDFIEAEAVLEKGSRVLDLMCGYGRHTLELARRGASLTAVDLLPEYIAEIDSMNKGWDVNTICSSAVTVSLEGRYQAVICMGNSLSFFNREEARAILGNLAAHLEPGGSIIINTWTLAEIAIKYFKEKDWFYVGDLKYLIDNTFLFDPSRIETDHILESPDGKSETIRGVDYVLTIDEFNSLLREVGLEIKAVYATPRKRIFRFGDTRAYIVAGPRVNP